jgi:hypothetical protein
MHPVYLAAPLGQRGSNDAKHPATSRTVANTQFTV